jgi:hypothetical protein
MQIQQRKDGNITIHGDGTNQRCPFASTAAYDDVLIMIFNSTEHRKNHHRTLADI